MPILCNIHAANEFASLSQVSQDTRFVDFGLADNLLPRKVIKNFDNLRCSTKQLLRASNY
jgi:hypothetical protein